MCQWRLIQHINSRSYDRDDNFKNRLKVEEGKKKNRNDVLVCLETSGASLSGFRVVAIRTPFHVLRVPTGRPTAEAWRQMGQETYACNINK